ncbi:MAG: hypothetical protein AAGG53_13550 [Cyanobacteria bacterium P01_H01_bin.152]
MKIDGEGRYGQITGGHKNGEYSKSSALVMAGEHSFTAISTPLEVHANHREAQNTSIRRRYRAYCRHRVT